jgi:hypothetical protein
MSYTWLVPPPLIPGDNQLQNSQVNNDLKVFGDMSCGSLSIDSVGSSSGFFVNESGVYAKQGVVGLTAGSATVSSLNVASNARIFLSHELSGPAGSIGTLYLASVTAGATNGQFIIQSTAAADASTVAWLMTNPTSSGS